MAQDSTLVSVSLHDDPMSKKFVQMGEASSSEPDRGISDMAIPDGPRPIPWIPERFCLTGLWRECSAEFWGTFILIMFGDGVVANVVLGNGLLNTACAPGKACDPIPGGGWLSINIAWGLAVLFGILASAKISGAHLNPAVTFSLACFKGFPWRKVIPYSLAQTFGAFMAAAVIYSTYLQGFNALDPDRTMATAGIFATYPKPWLSNAGAFWDQVVGTALLMAGIISIGDSKNVGLSSTQGPFAVALLVVVIGQTYGIQAGYAINPARDFGPRLFTLIAGWGTQVFTASNYYFWVPIVGPLVGGPIGTFLYMLFVEQHHDKQA
eukprot:comp20052_c0_seq2/m.24641 comp20052_c0_seq2/g.24641  ORF comp20052_c0_seq2/g.24641 comp20052_c0_seq2/m.24641 type:complete len:323 (-) comp20052_c0_seq2:472-1440(-)